MRYEKTHSENKKRKAINSLTRRSVAASIAALLAACSGEPGLVQDDHGGETLATFKGSLSASASTQIDGEVSLAILWMPKDVMQTGSSSDVSGEPAPPVQCTGTPPDKTVKLDTVDSPVSWVTQPVSYAASFPINFQIPMNMLPPKEVRVDASAHGGSGEFATGMLVAYQDANNDGTLNLSRPDDPGDPLLAVSKEWIMFLDGTLPPVEGDDLVGQVPQGFSLLYMPGIGSDGAAAPPGETTEGEVKAAIYPADTPIALHVAQSAEEQAALHSIACETSELRTERGGDPSAGGDGPLCSPDGRSWQYVAFEEELCRTIYRITGACLAEAAPVPADWPCAPGGA